MSQTQAWLHVFPQFLFAIAMFTVPGLLVAVGLRFRAWDSVALSIPLSLGVFGVANLVSSHLGIAWSLPLLVYCTVGIAASCAALFWGTTLWRRRRVTGETVGDPRPSDGAAWGRRQHLFAVIATLGAALVGAVVVARGIGWPTALNQSYDAAFHVNSIMEVAQFHVASPSFLAQLGYPSGTGGFYPPTFAAAGALLVNYTGVTPYVAANVATAAMAALWPVSISMLVRRIARPSAFGYAVAMLGAVTIGLFPALLLVWGTLWPNTLSVLTIAPALVLVMRVVGVDRTARGADDPHRRLGWWQCVAGLLVTAIGMVFVQPNALFLVFYLGLPLTTWALWRRWMPTTLTTSRKLGLMGAALMANLALVAAVTWVARHFSSIETTAAFHSSLAESIWSAIGQVLTLTTPLSHPNYAFAVLAVIGICAGMWSARGRYLVFGYVLIALMAVLSAGADSPPTRYFTGYWYNDPHRFFGLLPLFVLPLSALGADACRAVFTNRMERRARRTPSQARGWWPTTATVAAIVVCLGILTLQGGLGTARISGTVVQNYSYKVDGLVSPGQTKMFRRLAGQVPPGQTIAGSPYTGEILAGVVSGHDVVYPTFRRPLDPVSAFVALNFNQYQSNPAVCAAVQSLRIGVVVTARNFAGAVVNLNWQNYAGFDNMDMIPGLTKIDSGGGAAAYRVGPCKAYPYPLGLDASPEQNVMFATLAKSVPLGMSIGADPFDGGVLAGVLSGANVLYPTFSRPPRGPEALVAAKFNEFQTNRAVCAAVKKLNLGVVVSGVSAGPKPAWAAKAYAGFKHLDSVPGLTVIASAGGATAYRVGDCQLPVRHDHKKLRIKR